MSQYRINEVENRALRYLRNSLVHEGKSPSVRELATFLGYKSPRSAHLILEGLIDKGLLKRSKTKKLQFAPDFPVEDTAMTVDIPIVGTAACGLPLLAQENIEAKIQVSTKIAKPGFTYFILRALGDSMNNTGINDGDLVLVRSQQSAENGARVVALIDNEATIKEFWRGNGVVLLKPNSTNNQHRPIILTENFLIQGEVITVIPDWE
jgi:repressor LexA